MNGIKVAVIVMGAVSCAAVIKADTYDQVILWFMLAITAGISSGILVTVWETGDSEDDYPSSDDLRGD